LNNINEIVATHYSILVNSCEESQVLSLNRIYLISSEDKYILKVYNPINCSSSESSAKIQDILSGYDMAPKVKSNVHGSVITKISNTNYMVEEYLENKICSDFHGEEDLLSSLFSRIKKMYHIFDLMKGDIIQPNKSSSPDLNKKNNFVYDKNFTDYLDYKSSIINEMNIPKIREEKKQLIHGDLRIDNVIYTGKDFYFIDFDFCRKGSRINEILKFLIILSDFNIYKFKEYEKYFNNLFDTKFKKYNIYYLLSYLLYSDFPANYLGLIDNLYILNIIQERKKLIDFCIKYLKKG